MANKFLNAAQLEYYITALKSKIGNQSVNTQTFYEDVANEFWTNLQVLAPVEDVNNPGVIGVTFKLSYSTDAGKFIPLYKIGNDGQILLYSEEN